MLKIIVLLICDLIFGILLVYFAPLPTDEGEGKTAYRGVVGDGGVVDCDALLASAASCSISFSSKTRYSFTPLINEDRMSLNGCTASKVGGVCGHGEEVGL